MSWLVRMLAILAVTSLAVAAVGCEPEVTDTWANGDASDTGGDAGDGPGDEGDDSVDWSTSCEGRCGEPWDPDAPCGCYDKCDWYQECCDDYELACLASDVVEDEVEDDEYSFPDPFEPSELSYGDCRGLASETASYCQTDDCEGIVQGNSSKCSTPDCKGLASEDASKCSSNFCKALVKKEANLCPNNDCQAMVEGSTSYCQSTQCKAIVSGSPFQCPGD